MKLHKDGLGLRKIARILKIPRSTVGYWIYKGTNPVNSKNFFAAEITKEMLYDLYWKNNLSIREVAKKCSTTKWTIIQKMRSFDIPRRNRMEEAIKANIKRRKPKLPFSGNKLEKSYILGLLGDVTVQKAKLQVQASVGSTHPKMLELFDKVFCKYAPTNKLPVPIEFNHRKTYGWLIYCLLDESFYFLLDFKKRIDREILLDDKAFFAFLSGYMDAEGCILIRKNGKYVSFEITINSEDYEILQDLYLKLRWLGYHPNLRLLSPKGTLKDGYPLNKDMWQLYLKQRKEVIDILKKSSLKHEEKRAKRLIILNNLKAKYWFQVENEVRKLKEQIRTEVENCIKEAEKAYLNSHPHLAS